VKKIRMDSKLERYIHAKLKERRSPELIAGRRNRENTNQISYKSIYRYVYSRF